MPPPPGSPGAPITPRALPPFSPSSRELRQPHPCVPVRATNGRPDKNTGARRLRSAKRQSDSHRKPAPRQNANSGVAPDFPGTTPLCHAAQRSAPTAPPEGKSGISFSEDCRFRSSRSSSRDAPRGAFRRRSPRHGRCPPSGSRRPPRGGSPNKRVSREWARVPPA